MGRLHSANFPDWEVDWISVSFLLNDHDGLRYFVNKMAEVSIAFVDPLADPLNL